MTTTAADTDGTIAQVEFFHGTTLIGTATAAPYRVLWNGVPAGSYSLTATATDNQGAATGSDARAVTVNATNTPPTVSLIAPADGAAYVLPVTVTLSATASGIEDNTPITRVDFHHGSTLIGGSTTAPYTTTWAPPTAGTYHLTAVATDSAGGVTTSAARTITVQGANQLPNVSLTSPLANQSFTAPANIALAAIASDADGTIARVEFFQGSTLIGSATAAPYGAAWNNVPAGSYILTARATDDRGATRSTTAIPITVTGGGPSILYLHGDHLGTPRVATNEANVVVWRNPPTTEPFGMALPEEDPDGDGRPTVINLRFPGQYFDRETLLHYNYFRDHYFPDLGRYGQSDPIGLAGGINTYGYVEGNPLSYTDPLGLDRWGEETMRVYTDRAANKTLVFHPSKGKILEFETRTTVASNAQAGADGPYNGTFTFCQSVPEGSDSSADGFGPLKWRTTDSRGRWIHGGGTGLDDPYNAPRQGWKPTLGCTRAQNEDVKSLCDASKEWVKKNPGKKITYQRQ